jgi:hypothetical protein
MRKIRSRIFLEVGLLPGFFVILENQPPIQKETSSMPAHDRFWSDDEERPLPTGPASTSNYPE